MAKNQTVRLRPVFLQADLDALAALKNIAGYTPANPDYTVVKLDGLNAAMSAAQQVETQKAGELAAARDDATAAEWEFHNALLGMKDQVKAQFGADSNQWQSIGQTKKSEYAKPAPAKPTPPAK